MSDPDESGGERRRHARTPLSMLVQYRFDTFEDFLAEYTLNLSPGGIFISTDAPREIGAIVYLQFALRDGSRLIEGMGRVVRVDVPRVGAPGGMGIEFLDFDEDSLGLVRKICSKRVSSE